MTKTRDIIKKYLGKRVLNSVTGQNNKTAQNQGMEDESTIFGLYDECGDWVGETKDIEKALNYVGL